MSNNSGRSILVTDLFAGAGGLTQGFVEASSRFIPHQAVEWDIDAAATYKQNFPNAKVFNESITDWVVSGDVRNTDVVVGGPPCQGFSALGKRQENDEKNFLWHQYAEVVRKSTPKYFVMENVPQFKDSQQRGVFRSEIESGKLQDYSASLFTINTANYGSPQVRKRMIILGWHKDLDPLPLPAPTIEDPADYATVRNAFGGLVERVETIDLPSQKLTIYGKRRPGPFFTSELHVTRNFSELSMERFSWIPPGGNRFDLPDKLKAPCWLTHTSGSGDVMGRLHWDKPSVTIRTEFNKPEKGRYLHPVENRAITHQEAARLMGFPDTYRWVGTKTSIARQIGNAVPIELGKEIAKRIAELIP